MTTAVDAQASKYSDVALLIGRVLIGILFLIAAYNKARGYGGAMGYFGRLGIPVPAVTVPLTILFEAAVGIMLIVGYQTRIAALGIAAFCVLTGLIAHTNIGDGNQLNHLLKNLAIAGAGLAFFVTGPGVHSLDAKRR